MISERFKKAVLKELKLSDYDFRDALQANEVPGWDSLTHAAVITALEKEYKVRLKNVEILNCANLGDLQKLIDSKL
ncbi:MAG: acyl carrier protein [Bacteroidota bacterium]